MRSNPTGNVTLQRIQQEINEIAQRENELRSLNSTNGVSNGDVSPPLTRALSSSSLTSSQSSPTTTSRRFIPNTNAKGMMQKFFKLRGKLTAVSAIANPTPAVIAWDPVQVSTPTKSLIPADKPLRRGYVPVEQRIKKELHEMKSREDELKSQRRKSQPDLMSYLENEDERVSRSPSPIHPLRSSRSLVHLLDDNVPFETVSAPPSLRPALSLAQLCDAPDEEIESPRALIQHWESRIRQSQNNTQL